MITQNDYFKLAKSVDATLEEDSGYRDIQVFQMVAPKGKLWISEDSPNLRFEIATGNTDSAKKFNQVEFDCVCGNVSVGFREMSEEEKDLFAED